MEIENANFAFNLLGVITCILCGALGAGLTMGLMSIEKTKLEIVQMTGSPSDSEAAKTIIPILGNHHLLLVTLLLFNAVANEAMPVFLEKLVPPYIAVLLSVSLVLIFGEIIPSALFTGKKQFFLASKMSSFVWFLIYALYPITFPISKILDFVFGNEEEQSYSRNELEALVILQNAACRDEYEQVGASNENSELSRDEIGIMTGVLRLSSLTALDAMIPIDKVSMISSDVILDESALEQIMVVGYSRYPVFDETDRGYILGYLLVKKLIVVNPREKKKITSIELFEPIVVHPDEDLLEMLNIFQEGKSHLALVSNDPETTLRCIQEKIAPVSEQSKVLGIITLENIIEKIIQEEIYDESDRLRAPKTLKIPSGSSRLHFAKETHEPNKIRCSSHRSLSYSGGSSSNGPVALSPSSSSSSLEKAPLLPRYLSGGSPSSSVHKLTATETGTSTPSANSLWGRKRKQSLSVRPIPPKDVANMPQPSLQRIKRYSTFDSLRSLKTKFSASGSTSTGASNDITFKTVADNCCGDGKKI